MMLKWGPVLEIFASDIDYCDGPTAQAAGASNSLTAINSFLTDGSGSTYGISYLCRSFMGAQQLRALSTSWESADWSDVALQTQFWDTYTTTVLPETVIYTENGSALNDAVYKDGCVFVGWTDAEGNDVTEATVGETSTAVTLTAKYSIDFDTYHAAEDGRMVDVTGVITDTHNFYGGKVMLFMQDADGGYYVYSVFVADEDTLAADLAVGNTIMISGEKDIYSGLDEIKNATYKVISTYTETVEAMDITDILTAATEETDLSVYQGQLVTLTNVTVTTAMSGDYHTAMVTLGENEYEISLGKYGWDAADVTAMEAIAVVDAQVSVTGIVGWHNDTISILPATATSLTTYVAPVE